MDYKAIGRRLRKRRLEMGLTLEHFSEMAGISTSFLGHIERGTRVMSVDTLCALAKTANCSTDYLLGRNVFPLSHEENMDKLINDMLDRIVEIVRERQGSSI